MSWITSLPVIAGTGICTTSRQEIALVGDPCVHAADRGPPYVTGEEKTSEAPYDNDLAPFIEESSCNVYIGGRQIVLNNHPAAPHGSDNTSADATGCGAVRFCGNRIAHRLGERRHCNAITIKYENDTAGRFNIF